MYINTKKMVGYLIHKSSENSYQLCRIIKEYNNFEDADKDLMKLLTNKTTEGKINRGR